MIPLRASLFPFIVCRRRRWAGRHLHIVECGVKELQQKGTTGYRARNAWLVETCRRRLTNLVPGFCAQREVKRLSIDSEVLHYLILVVTRFISYKALLSNHLAIVHMFPCFVWVFVL